MLRSHPVISGLEVLAGDPALLSGRRWALVANQAAVTRSLRPAWQVLAGAGTLVRLFAPEHGLWGVAQDMEAVDEERHDGRVVRSLYGRHEGTLRPRGEDLEDLDAVVVDLPDIGCRYYTFAATLAHVMAACEASGVEVVVCDRPNPIGGLAIEGGPVESGCRSFVSELPVPVRHGLTLGELALLLQAERHPSLTLAVVSCLGWRRREWWHETGLPWVAPSPNIPTPETAAVYPGACLAEATNLSEGRGTTRPFHLLGAPWLDGEALAGSLNALDLPGVVFQATRFRPEFHKHAGTVCGGVAWHLTDREALRPVATGVAVLAAAWRLAPDQCRWRQQPYEFVDGVPALDLLTGSPLARAVVEGRTPLAALAGSWEPYEREFSQRRRAVLLYRDGDDGE